MDSATIPGIEARTSRFVLGTMTFGDTVDRETSAEMVRTAVDAGVTVIDTANGYAGGETERILGGILPGYDDLVLCTKAGMPHPDAGDHAPLSREGLRKSLGGSLGRLGRDSIDLFYLHQPDRATPIEETLETLAEFLDDGTITAWGVSNYAAWQIADLDAAARALEIPGPAVAQQLYNLVARRIEDEYAEYAVSHGLSTMVYNPLGGGLLTGRHSFEGGPGQHGRFADSRLAAMYTERYWNEDLFRAIGRLQEIAEEAGLPLIELALRWLVSQPVTDSLLLGGSKPSQLLSNLEALARGPLPEDVLTACDEAGAALRGPMPAYNR